MAPDSKAPGLGGPSLAIARFVQRTGMHAVPSIATERTKVSRIGWTLLLTLAVTLLVVQVTKITVKLRSYQTSTDTKIRYDSPMRFPAVTICNLNPIIFSRLSSLKKSLQEAPSKKRKRRETPQSPISSIWGILFNEEDEKKEPQASRYIPPSRPEPEMNIIDLNYGKQNFVTKPTTTPKPTVKPKPKPKRRNDHLRKDSLMREMNQIEEENRNRLMYSLNHLVIDCSFQDRTCDWKNDFVRIKNPRYGACYIFNSGLNASRTNPVKTITNSGTDNGLELTLFVDEDNYLPGATTDVGFKILVHDQTSPPMPDRDGFMLRPGAFTMLGLRATEIERAEEPYGNCKHFSRQENEERNMFLDILPMTSPTMTTCMRTCEQSEILYHCGCYSLQHGYSSAPAFKNFNDTVRNRACDLSGDDYECVIYTLKLETKPDSYCKKTVCKHHECLERRFRVSQSTSRWPSKSSYKEIQRSWQRGSSYHYLYDKFPIQLDYLKENFLKVRVYFEDLNVIRIRTYPSYQFVDFLSDLGGQGGLWLGISAFTAVEFLVLLGELGHLSVLFFLGKREPPDRAVENDPNVTQEVSKAGNCLKIKEEIPGDKNDSKTLEDISKDDNRKCV